MKRQKKGGHFIFTHQKSLKLYPLCLCDSTLAICIYQNMHPICQLSLESVYCISPPKIRKCDLAVPCLLPTGIPCSKYFQSQPTKSFPFPLHPFCNLIVKAVGQGMKEGGEGKYMNNERVKENKNKGTKMVCSHSQQEVMPPERKKKFRAGKDLTNHLIRFLKE